VVTGMSMKGTGSTEELVTMLVPVTTFALAGHTKTLLKK
jgi:hypothetical protein